MLEHWQVLVGVLVPLFYGAGVACAIAAIMTARTPQGAVAWAVSLISFPFVAVPLYAVFGRNRYPGYAMAMRVRGKEHSSRMQDLFEVVRRFKATLPADIENHFGVLNKLGLFPFMRGNKTELLIDGEATFARIFAAIDQAKQYVLVQFYIVRADGIGQELKQHLLEAAKRGVKVYLLYDDIGSLALPRSYLQELKHGGVQVAPFTARRGWRINFRNHRKIVVCDGDVAFVGGFNVGDEYMGRSPKFGHWRDTHLKVEGPAVLTLQAPFVADWYWVDRQVLELDWEPRIACAGGPEEQPVLVLPSGPADETEVLPPLFTHCIHEARKRVWIATPYFVPDAPVLEALTLAAKRGLDVRVIIPEKADSMAVDLAMYSYIPLCVGAGVKMYRYTAGFMHQKVLLIDDELASVGTANQDNRSYRLNFEVTAMVVGAKFAGEVERMLEADFARGRRVMEEELTGRKFPFRFGVRVARLFEPAL